jgi:ABC-2 family transporter protein
MIDLAPPPAPSLSRARTMALRPTFWGALRGIWLFTWKTQLSWPRISLNLSLLLILPALIYITTLPPRAWNQRHRWIIDPLVQLNAASKRLARSDLPLQAGQRIELLRIFNEESERTDADWNRSPASDTDSTRRNALMKAWLERVLKRAQTVLDERQFAEFQSFEKRKLEPNLQQANEPAWDRTGPFYHWLIDLYFFVLLPLNCVRGCGGLIRDELQSNTLSFLTTRPLSRAGLLIAKYISQVGLLQITLGAQTILVFAAAYLRLIPSLGALLPVFLAAQFLAVPAWSALGAFLGLFSRRYLALALVYGAIVELGIGRIPTNINTLSLMRHLKTLLAQNQALRNLYDWSDKGALLSAGALIAATGIFLTLAALLFTFREYHHSTEMQK